MSRLTGDPAVTTISGFDAVRQYVADSFVRATPGIRYTLDASYAGTDSVILQYTVHLPGRGDRHGTDLMRLGADGKDRGVALPLSFRRLTPQQNDMVGLG